MTFRSLAVSLGLTVGFLGLAQTAGAAPAVLWACHGPSGQALGQGVLTPGFTGDGTVNGDGCASPDGTLSASFVRSAPAAGSSASWRADVPAGTALTGVRVDRSTTGFDGASVAGSPQRYALETPGGVLESADLDDPLTDRPLSGPATFASNGSYVRLGVSCATPAGVACAAPPVGTVGVTASRLALVVDDAAAPLAAVGGVQSPASGTLPLSVRATDAGLGLASATVTLDGVTVAGADLRTAGCADLSPADPAVDLPLGAGCAHALQDVALPVDSTMVPDGQHRLVVAVSDVAGNVAIAVDQDVSVLNHRAPSSSTATLAIGGGGTDSGGGDGGNGGGGNGGAGGGGGSTPPPPGSTTCKAPKLSMMLSQKPLRVQHHVVVLRRNRHYSFTGRLTCTSGTKRRSAPKGTVVSNFNIINGHTVRKSRLKVQRKGHLSARLAYRTSRTLVFSYRSLDHKTTKVKIKILVARR